MSTPADTTRARSLRASIAGLMRALHERTGAPLTARPRGAPVDPFALGALDADGVVLALRVCQLPGDLAALRPPPCRRCSARCRDGNTCNARAVKGRGRCRLHGGESTGPRTSEGRLRTLAGAVARRRHIPIEEALVLVRTWGEAARNEVAGEARVAGAATP